MTTKTAVVLLSGGLDSTTALAMAQATGAECYALSFNYGQRCSAELAAAVRIAKYMGVVAHQVVNMYLASIVGSALTVDSYYKFLFHVFMIKIITQYIDSVDFFQ